MDILEIVTVHPNGEFDVRTKGTAVFRVLEAVNEIPGKLYSGAIVNYPDNTTGHDNTGLSRTIVAEVRRLYTLMNVQEKFPVFDDGAISYKIAHFVGLSPRQEYELLSIFTELQRLEYLRRHLNAILPFLNDLELMKKRVQLNGHFRHLSAGDPDNAGDGG